MKNKIFTFCLWAALSPALFSCGSSKEAVYTYEPKTDQVEWTNGHKTVILNNIDFLIKLRFDHFLSGEMVYNVEIQNKSKLNQLFVPENCYLNPINKSDTMIFTIYAANPDEVIGNLQKQIDNFGTDQLKGEAVLCCFQSLCGVASTAVTGPKSKEQQESDNYTRQQESIQRSQDAQVELQKLKDQLVYEKKFLLRKNTIHPDETVAGKIYFHLSKQDSSYVVYIPVGETTLSATFDKTLLTPAK